MNLKKVAVTLAVSLLLTACTTQDDPVLRSADPAARPGGILRVATTAPGGVDPGNVYEPVGALIARTMCTPLLGTDPETGEIVPGIVSSYVVSDNGQILTLRLRDDVVFSDGSELTSADVGFTLSRIASADYASTSAELLEPIDGYAETHGDKPTDKGIERQRLRGVRVSDDRNVQIVLARPLSDFLRVLTGPLTAPVSKKAAERDPDGFARNPVCVGPYRLAEPYAPEDASVRLVRSEAYAPVDSARTRGGASYADEVLFSFFPDDAAAAAAVTAGEADVAPAAGVRGELVQSAPGPMVEYLGLPAGTEAFEDPRVRRAFALALDREELVRRVFPDTREPADGFLPATAEDADDCDSLPPTGDVAGARALLIETGGDLVDTSVPFYFNDELRNRELVAEVSRQLASALGVRAVPTPMTFAEFVDKGTSTSGFDGLFRFSWSVPHPSVDGYLHPLFSSDRIGRDNLSRFSDPAVDRTLMRVAREAEDEQDRELGYAQVLDLLCDRMPMVPLTTSLSRWLVGPDWASAVGDAVDGSTGQVMLRELFRR